MKERDVRKTINGQRIVATIPAVIDKIRATRPNVPCHRGYQHA